MANSALFKGVIGCKIYFYIVFAYCLAVCGQQPPYYGKKNPFTPFFVLKNPKESQ